MEPTLTPRLAPCIVAGDAQALIEFIERGIGGKLSFQEVDRDGRLVHAEVQIEDGLVMMSEPPQGRSPFPAMLHLYVQNSDAAYRRALEAGATEVRPPADAPDGFRRGGVKDKWGNEWWFSSQIRKA
jgi:PhnB protein